jgi:hypothetical protein
VLASRCLDQTNVRAHDPAQLDIADAVVNRVFVWDPALLNKPALHADFRGDGRDHSRVIRLHAADRHKRVSPRCDRVRDDVLELAQLVPSKR